MPQENCDTGRRIFKTKGEAQAADPGGRADHCDRCKGWHAKSDRPKSRRGRRLPR